MITMQRVRELAGQRHRPAVTSLYLDVDGRRDAPVHRVPDDRLQRFGQIAAILRR